MAEKPRIMPVELDEAKRPTVSLTKILTDFKILKTARIRCVDRPSLLEGIQNYVTQHFDEWGVKATDNIGVQVKGREGYNAPFNSSGYSLKTVVFYRINDNLG